MKITRPMRRAIVGGIKTAMTSHPKYFTELGAKKAQNAIAKRVEGMLRGLPDQTDVPPASRWFNGGRPEAQWPRKRPKGTAPKGVVDDQAS